MIVPRPRVSILVPAFNAASTVVGAVRSALNQAVPGRLNDNHVETIVYDDGSNDRTLALLRETFGSSVQVVAGGTNLGGGVARNRLLQAASGTYVQFLDADDWLPPGKVAAQLDWAGDASVVYSAPTVIPAVDLFWQTIDAGQVPNAVCRKSRLKEMRPRLCPSDPWFDFLRWRNFQTSSMLFRREALVDAGGWKDDQLRCQEHELILRLLQQNAKFAWVDGDAGAVYRVHDGGSVSRRDPVATIRTRGELIDTTEKYLRLRDSWTRRLSRAAAATRLESARSAWDVGEDQMAISFFRQAGRSGVLTAEASNALPRAYRMTAALLGLTCAQRIGQWRRGVK